jgi:outer membrane protein assembly factor BamB
MTKKPFILLILAVLAVLLLSSCAGGNALAAATSWPGITADPEAGIAYLSAGPHVFALTTNNGTLAWRYPEEPARNVTFYAAPTLAGSLVVAGDYKNSVHAINAQDGREAWIFADARDRFIASAAFASDTIIAPSADFNIYAINMNGSLNYKIETNQINWASAVTDGTTVYAPSMDHNVYAFDANSGNEQWVTNVDGAVAAAPALDNGVLYLATLGKEVIALNTSDGSIRWRADAEDYVWSAPSVKDGLLIVINASGTIMAFDTENGTQLWTATASGNVTASAVFHDEVFFVVTHNLDIIALDFDGTKIWTSDAEISAGSFTSTPVIVDDLIIIPVTQSADKWVIAYDLNGNEVWSFTPEN